MRIWLLVAYVLIWGSLSREAEGQSSGNENYAIVIHGGAGGEPDRWPEEYKDMRRKALAQALDHGVKMLQGGAKALDVVEQVINIMEDEPCFNAGRGAVLNEQGEHELDASIMDGRDLSCGAVGSVRQVKHPISLARKVMTETRHVLLIGNGADQFGISLGLPIEEASYFRTEDRLQQWKAWKENRAAGAKAAPERIVETYFGTVGCVVVDCEGNLAAGTSTGGLMGKRWGRVGDSPIIGAGNYADNGTCAVSCTGTGEEFIRRNIAADIAARMRYRGDDLALAAKGAVGSLPANSGGIIAVDAQRNLVMEFNTKGMSRAFANSSGDRGILLGREE